MTTRGTVGLALTFAALVAYLVLTRQPATPPRRNDLRLAPALDAATAVEIVRPAGTVRLERSGPTWSDDRAADLLDALDSLTILTVIDESPRDPELYGFGADAVRLRVLADSRELMSLEIGAMNPAGTGVYVRRAGETRILLTGSLLHWDLEKLRRVASATPAP